MNKYMAMVPLKDKATQDHCLIPPPVIV